HFPESERFTAWQELLGRRLLKVEIEPLPASPLYCDIKLYALPGLAAVFGSCSGARLAPAKALIDSDDLTFAVSASGHWRAAPRGGDAALGTGDAILISKADAVTVTISAWQGMVFSIPATAIAPLVPDPYAVVGRPIPGTSPALQLLVSYLGQLRNGPALTSPGLQPPFATHAHDLVPRP